MLKLKGMDVFGGAVWGGNPESAIRVPTSAEAQDTVLAALLETPFKEGHRSPLDWVISLVVHAIAITILVVAPLVFTQRIDLHSLEVTYLTTSIPHTGPPPPPPAGGIQKIAPHKVTPFVPGKLTAPFLIPRKVAVVLGADSAPDIASGVPGGVPGGTPGGVLGGIIGGASTEAPPIPPPTAKPKQKEILRVGGNVTPPRVLYAPLPKYPLLARSAHIGGCVTIDAIIDEEGNVVTARAVGGPPVLFAEALRTIMLWKYEPTYLNGVAYPITLTATVTFSLGS